MDSFIYEPSLQKNAYNSKNSYFNHLTNQGFNLNNINLQMNQNLMNIHSQSPNIQSNIKDCIIIKR